MYSSEYLKQFAEIENHLYELAPTFDRKLGFVNLLKNLKANNLVSADLLQNLSEMWQFRNKITASVGEISVDDAVVDKLKIVKQSLKI